MKIEYFQTIRNRYFAEILENVLTVGHLPSCRVYGQSVERERERERAIRMGTFVTQKGHFCNGIGNFCNQGRELL